MGNLPTYPSQLARTCYPEKIWSTNAPAWDLRTCRRDMGTWHWFKPKPNSPRRLNCIRGKNLENDIVMSVHITSLRPRLLLTLSQCNRCFVVGVDDTHTKTVAPIVSIEESFDSSFFLVCLQPRGRQGDRCKYMLRVYVFIFWMQLCLMHSMFCLPLERDALLEELA